MESLTEEFFPYRILDEQSGSHSSSNESGSATDAVIFFGISLVLGIASRHLLRGTRVPYTVALLTIGIALGSLGHILSIFFFSSFCIFYFSLFKIQR